MIATPRLAVAAALTLVAGCGHSEPFEVTQPTMDGPFSTEYPIRLTFSDGDDRTPSWLPDGSGIIYSSERLDEPAHDRCLLVLPPGGGTVDRSICVNALTHEDSTDRLESPAVSGSGRIAFLRAESRIGLQKGPRMWLMLGTIDDPLAAMPVTPVPYFAASNRTHFNASHLQWIGADRLVYLGENLFYEGSTFFPDTFTTGLEIMRGDASREVMALIPVPGTDYASSVAGGGDDDTIVFTLGGDSRVYRRSLASGEQTVLYDFAAAGIARDVQLHGSTLVAIVGGSVFFQFEDAHGWVQRDEGGYLHVVNLETGAEQVRAPEGTLFRRPSISPDGRYVVVEASPYAPVHVGPDSDFNAPNHRPDLWLFDLQ